ncbi:DUF6681 family protein [Paucilactobacillus kaifaensis]|uniref:DUF6681 family protein n=1 Tax=Paucilactobacillus kaifaensis TaxID=2559921 RepID=UPI0010F5E8B5|nr:DUF6681 family protein [Paucilactobacillus kaifaensis]
MLSFLDMINHSLGYFNVNSKLKNQIYTAVGFVGDWYLFYVAIRFFINHAWLRGFLFMLAFIALMYAVAMNVIYYFTDKTTKLDPSPKIEKLLGGRRVGEENRKVQPVSPNIPANGLFENDQVLPATVAVNEHEQANLNRVVKQLIEHNLLIADYNQMSEKEIINYNRKEKRSVPALRPDQTVPYFELVPTGSRLEVYIGMNQMERLAVGHLTSVGLTEVVTARKNYKLFLANVFITDGPEKIAGRSQTTIVKEHEYGLNVKVAYKTK